MIKKLMLTKNILIRWLSNFGDFGFHRCPENSRSHKITIIGFICPLTEDIIHFKID